MFSEVHRSGVFFESEAVFPLDLVDLSKLFFNLESAHFSPFGLSFIDSAVFLESEDFSTSGLHIGMVDLSGIVGLLDGFLSTSLVDLSASVGLLVTVKSVRDHFPMVDGTATGLFCACFSAADTGLVDFSTSAFCFFVLDFDSELFSDPSLEDLLFVSVDLICNCTVEEFSLPTDSGAAEVCPFLVNFKRRDLRSFGFLGSGISIGFSFEPSPLNVRVARQAKSLFGSG